MQPFLENLKLLFSLRLSRLQGVFYLLEMLDLSFLVRGGKLGSCISLGVERDGEGDLSLAWASVWSDSFELVLQFWLVIL